MSTIILTCVAGLLGAAAVDQLDYLAPLPALLAALGLQLGITKAKQSFLLGTCTGGFFGFVGWLGSAWWLAEGVNSMNSTYLWAGYLVAFIASAWGAIPYAIYGGIASALNIANGTVKGAVFSATLLSFILILWPATFPGTLVLGLVSIPELLQTAAIGGEPLVGFFLYLAAFLLSNVVTGSKRSKLTSLGSHIFLVTVLSIYGTLTMRQLDTQLEQSAHLFVGAIQPGIPIEGGGNPLALAGSKDELMKKTKQLLGSENIDLIVWPEIPLYFSPKNVPGDKATMEGLLAGTNTPVLVNADMYTNERVFDRVPFYNTVQLLRGSGEIREEYRKRLLVPFGEYLPFEYYLTGPRLERIFAGARRYIAGDKNHIFQIGELGRIGTPICLEILHRHFVQNMVADGANVLINPSNDAYFGATKAADVSFAFAVLRAVENRVSVLRITNSGRSGLILPTGQVQISTVIPLAQVEKRVFKVPVYR